MAANNFLEEQATNTQTPNEKPKSGQFFYIS